MVMDIGSLTGLDWSFVYDRLLSVDGAVAAVGGATLLYGTTALNQFFSGGPKNWLSAYEAMKSGLYGDPKKGIVFGRYRRRLVCYEGINDVLIIGTKGTGKSVSVFLPTIPSNTTHGMLIYDQSGGLFNKTSGARAEIGDVYRINPDVEESDCMNLLDMIPTDIELVSSLRALYAPFFDGSTDIAKKSGGDSHWPNAGHKLLVFGTIHVLLGEDPQIKNIPSILSLMSDIVQFLEHMVRYARDPMCRDVAVSFLGSGRQYCGNVMSNVDQAMSVFHDPAVARITSYSSFHIEDLATSKKPITVYLTAPTVKVRGLMPYYVGIEQAMKLHLMKHEDRSLMGKKKLRPVMVLDDEAQSTNRPDIKILLVSRKYGVQYVFGAQSYNGMKKMYGDDLGLFKTKLLFRSPDGDDDLKAMSAISGFYRKKEVRYSSDSSSGGGRKSQSWEWKDAPRLTEREVGEWGPFGIALLSIFGVKPAVIRTFDAEHDKQFKSLFKEPYQSTIAKITRSPWHSYSRPIIAVEANNTIDAEADDVEDIDDAGSTVMVAF
jgi:type IV secretory pathway TraG/TraD family ATPase VirD4